MDFFNDDFGFGDSPYLKTYKNASKNLDANKSGKSKDDFDDLLDEMLDKEKKKNTKQKNNQISSFNSLTSIDKIASPAKPQNATKKLEGLDNYNVALIKNQSDFGKSYEPLRNRQSSRSIQEDKGSQDNKSYKSGGTGFGGFDNQDMLKVPLQAEQIPQFSSSTRMMKPPLRKRADSKMGSQIAQDELRGTDLLNEVESPSLMRPPLPKKEPSPPKTNPQPSFMSLRNIEDENKIGSQGERQKIVYVKEESKNIREELDKQLKIIKQSHDKQMAYLREELEKQTKNGRQTKLKLFREFEQQRNKDRQLYQMVAQKDIDKIKDLYEWQIKRKTESYQLEIQNLKKLIDISTKAQSHTPSYNNEYDRQALQVKEKELQAKGKRMEDQEAHLKQKQKMIEFRESEFDNYRRREEEKLQSEKKQLLKMEAELRKRKMQLRKQIEEEKINMASMISKEQFDIARQREQIKLDKEEVEISRQLFEKQKAEYEEFNSNIMKDYKQKLKQLEIDRNYWKAKQIELYKKIQTVQMMGNLKAGRRAEEGSQLNQENINKNVQTREHQGIELKNDHRENPDNHAHIENRLKEKQLGLEENFNKSSLLNANKTNLKEYLLKVNRNNERMRPFLA